MYFSQKEIRFLGHNISGSEIRTVEDKKNVIKITQDQLHESHYRDGWVCEIGDSNLFPTIIK